MNNCIVLLLFSQQQEQDPTNLYIANLPLNFKENDVEALLAQYGQVISTRILRDTSGQSKGVGFARFVYILHSRHFVSREIVPQTLLFSCRMESKEKCEQIIQMFNGKALAGAKDPLLVKFADGGNKKKSLFKNAIWRETGEVRAFYHFSPNLKTSRLNFSRCVSNNCILSKNKKVFHRRIANFL